MQQGRHLLGRDFKAWGGQILLEVGGKSQSESGQDLVPG